MLPPQPQSSHKEGARTTRWPQRCSCGNRHGDLPGCFTILMHPYPLKMQRGKENHIHRALPIALLSYKMRRPHWQTSKDCTYLDQLGGWKKCRNPLWRLCLPQCKIKAAAKKKRDSRQNMLQIRSMVVGNILVEYPATTHFATFSPPSLSAMSCKCHVTKFLTRMLWCPEKCWNHVLQLLAQFLFRRQKMPQQKSKNAYILTLRRSMGRGYFLQKVPQASI